jgi:hypothetical protein
VEQTRKRFKSDRLEPRQIAVPDAMMLEFDRLVELVSARLGEPPEDVRRGVEISVLARGIERLKSEEGLR